MSPSLYSLFLILALRWKLIYSLFNLYQELTFILHLPLLFSGNGDGKKEQDNGTDPENQDVDEDQEDMDEDQEDDEVD